MTPALASLAGNEGDAGAEPSALLPVQQEAGACTPEHRDLEEGEQTERGGYVHVGVHVHVCGLLPKHTQLSTQECRE